MILGFWAIQVSCLRSCPIGCALRTKMAEAKMGPPQYPSPQAWWIARAPRPWWKKSAEAVLSNGSFSFTHLWKKQNKFAPWFLETTHGKKSSTSTMWRQSVTARFSKVRRVRQQFVRQHQLHHHCHESSPSLTPTPPASSTSPTSFTSSTSVTSLTSLASLTLLTSAGSSYLSIIKSWTSTRHCVPRAKRNDPHILFWFWSIHAPHAKIGLTHHGHKHRENLQLNTHVTHVYNYQLCFFVPSPHMLSSLILFPSATRKAPQPMSRRS